MTEDPAWFEDPKGEMVPLGVISRPFGLKGELRLHLYNHESSVISDLPAVFIQYSEDRCELARIRRWRRHGDGIVVTLAGCADRSAAEDLRGAAVLVPREALPDVEGDEFYDVDLVGLTITSPSNQTLGTVVEVEHPPAHDVVVVRLVNGSYVDVPLIGAYVRDIDLDAGTIQVDLPDELPTRRTK